MKPSKKIFLVYLAVFGITAFLLYNYEHLFITKEPRDYSQRFAKVISSQNNTKLKMEGQLNWAPLTNEDLLFDGDHLFSGKKSNIQFLTRHGHSFTVGEESLLKIVDEKIDLDDGNFSARLKKNKPIRLLLNSEIVTVKPLEESSIDINKSRNQQSFLTVLKGSVEIIKDSMRLIVQMNQKAQLTPQGHLALIGLKKISLKNSLYNGEYFCGDNSFELFWESETPVDEYKVTLYQDRFQKNKIKELTLIKERMELKAKNFKESYYIYIQGMKDKKVVSQLPLKRVVFLATNKLPSFQLKNHSLIKGETFTYLGSEFESLINQDKRFSCLFHPKDSQGSINFEELGHDSRLIPQGNYDSKTCYSHPACSPQKFCTKGEDFSIRELYLPKLKSPTNNQSFPLLNTSMNLDLQWEGVKKAIYKDLKLVLINKNLNDKKNYDIKTFKAGTNHFLIENLSQGDYVWYLEGKDSDTAFMTPKSQFSIEPISRPTKFKHTFLSFSKDSMNFRFSWEQNGTTAAADYFLEYKLKGKSRSFKLTSTQKKTKRIELQIPDATSFSWRLITKNKNEVLTDGPWQQVSPPSCTSAPKLLPQTISYQANSFPTFQWSNVYGAKYYILKIFRFGATSLKDSFKVKTMDTSYRWSSPKNADLNWTVTPIDIYGRACVSSSLGKYLSSQPHRSKRP